MITALHSLRQKKGTHRNGSTQRRHVESAQRAEVSISCDVVYPELIVQLFLSFALLLEAKPHPTQQASKLLNGCRN
eukprot:6461464-Amphidinium_carterae.1